ncbi:hypothetical protein [Rathayibacter tanaceti]|uniref:Uncharacterized protein n=2 Tax=Rathayibacter tanaceti TaxID=1671680 RepID=A0A166D6C4_9MICO|nr:hypothetical protein [Rathayibacter tanaceti]KZX21917.1 hypothetical protein ACH61_00960 [Rathayibacter tanaceti]QHC56452.1 hypothetical protein GSU10_12985 [Rathayibacter tanaceti]TCO36655.1 hypothetical protein EV639_10657 [Rathayibacter tanaceti]
MDQDHRADERIDSSVTEAGQAWVDGNDESPETPDAEIAVSNETPEPEGVEELNDQTADDSVVDEGRDAPPLDDAELDVPAVDAPELDAPELDAPESDAPELEAPALDAPEPDTSPLETVERDDSAPVEAAQADGGVLDAEDGPEHAAEPSSEPDRRAPVVPDNGYSRESYAIHATRSELPLFNVALTGRRDDSGWLSSLSRVLGGPDGPVGSPDAAAATAHAAIDRRTRTQPGRDEEPSAS